MRSLLSHTPRTTHNHLTVISKQHHKLRPLTLFSLYLRPDYISTRLQVQLLPAEQDPEGGRLEEGSLEHEDLPVLQQPGLQGDAHTH